LNNDVKISVIIPNLHSPMIDQTIQSVLAQKTKFKSEIIVVGMDKWGLVKNFSEVQFIKTPSPVGAAEARNIGIQAAQGEWLIFIDSDCVAQERWLTSFVKDFKEGWLVIGGGVRTPAEPYWRLVYNLSMFHKQLESQKQEYPRFLPTLNLAVHRRVIDHVGMLDENLLRGQDVDWTARMNIAGYKLLFDPAAVVEHLPARYDLRTLRDYFFKSGYYMIRVRMRYPEIYHMPKLLFRPWVWKVFAPIIAGWTTSKIILGTSQVRMNLQTIPHIYLLKVSWCMGASLSLKEINDGESEF